MISSEDESEYEVGSNAATKQSSSSKKTRRKRAKKNAKPANSSIPVTWKSWSARVLSSPYGRDGLAVPHSKLIFCAARPPLLLRFRAEAPNSLRTMEAAQIILPCARSSWLLLRCYGSRPADRENHEFPLLMGRPDERCQAYGLVPSAVRWF